MKTKIFRLLSLSVLATVMLISFAFALTLSAGTVTLSPNTLTKTLTVTGDTNFDVTSYPTTATITDSDSNNILVSITPTSTLTNVTSATFNVTAVNNKDFNFGKAYSTTIKINASSTANSSIVSSTQPSISFENDNYCSLGNKGGNLDVDVNIENTDGLGDDDEWFPLDNIKVEVEVKNSGNDDIDDIVIEWGLYDSDTNTWIIEDEEKKFNLKDGKKETVTFEFQVDPSDLDEEMDDDFTLYIKAYSDDLGEDIECTSFSDSEKITLEDDFVILDKITLPETASCGDEVQLTADVWNIGQEDQDEVSVTIYNKELGINKEVVVGDINAFDNEKLEFTFNVPEELKEKNYILEFFVYDEDHDIYENENDDQSKDSGIIKIESCAAKETKAVVSAELQSGGKAGEELVVKATVTNTGDDKATYSINAAAYTTWASSADLNKNTITLEKGASEDVLLTFNVNPDASGENTFDIELTSEGKLVTKQAVSVEIEAKKGFSLGGNFITKDNWYLWGIGALNIILVIIIIVVAVRVARK